ncbi:MAG: crotonase/enoyl-CoA hydratase family protein [Balneola sp.]|nr:crotonase/enoyl-CoA hydratase family protein [Balneola sp.]
MEYDHFNVDIEHKIARVAFNRPEKSNALNMEAWLEMRSIFQRLSETSEVRVIILSGEGKHFCTGIDLELLMSVDQLRAISDQDQRSEKAKEFILTLQQAVTSIEKCSKPVIAAVHNGCIGGGVDIIAACDLRYCTKDAYFCIKEIDLAMVADLGTLQRLPKIISPSVVAEMAYTGKNVFGPEAKEIHLVNECFDTEELLHEGVMKIASSIAEKSPISIRGTKNVLRHSRDHSVEDGLEYIADWNSTMLFSDDMAEVFEAMKEKRKPDFKD